MSSVGSSGCRGTGCLSTVSASTATGSSLITLLSARPTAIAAAAEDNAALLSDICDAPFDIITLAPIDIDIWLMLSSPFEASSSTLTFTTTAASEKPCSVLMTIALEAPFAESIDTSVAGSSALNLTSGSDWMVLFPTGFCLVDRTLLPTGVAETVDTSLGMSIAVVGITISLCGTASGPSNGLSGGSG